MFDEITLNRIKLLHPNYRKQIKDWYLEINRKLPKGVRLRFAHTYRSIEEQNKLYNQIPKVTNAKGGQSIHNFGLAFDTTSILYVNLLFIVCSILPFWVNTNIKYQKFLFYLYL